ncbi:ubiquinol-cytochrome c reductase iron-sulfur subunit [[Limnothrix rosea] IAM M-220]|uniref:QcrA and Rieske domain-containing protein n=1 Tax=[Limnothrix rosea] IAM M-220 TaxID=454133 RepID=UPI00096148F2|nr:Rieske (2Fe-2S) protein [[Limnothrix rosea] IAM M-220]OKH10773.1 cytochrome b6/f complex, alternative iron-sulfur subunit [[Limnothrix rosea] IAM M-220]
MERRKFMGLFGVGMLASSLPVVLAACSGNTTEEAVETIEEKATEAGEAAIAKAEEAGTVMAGYSSVGMVGDFSGGNTVSTEIDGKKVYVFQNPEDESIVAVDPTCNHQGCPVKLDGSELECSCHGSLFQLDGSYVSGPATAGLTVYEVKTEGEEVYVKV